MLKHRIGEECEGEVVDFGMNGEGIVKLDGYPVFVPFAIRGERVRIKLNFTKKDYGFGDIIEVLSPSNERIKPRCPYFGRCGGCDMQHMSLALQLETKRLNVERTLKKNAGLDITVPTPVSLNEWKYRNKLALPFGERNGRVVLGFFEKKSHFVVPLKFCHLHGEWAADLISVFTSWANENGVSVYDEKNGKGLLRHLVARKLERVDIVVVANGPTLPRVNKLIEKLDEKFHDYCLYISANTDNTNVIMGDGITLLKGEEKAQNLGRVSAQVSPLSFLQVNDKVRDAVYDAVSENLKDFDGEVVELYSGVGILTASLAERLPSTSFVSVEIVPEAVENARKLMDVLGFSHRIDCVCADAKEYMTSLTVEPKKRVLILDPPRKGVDGEVLVKALEADFEKIVYISCNPATLARDIKVLEPKYAVSLVQPYDMFPQTANVETLAVMGKRNE